jgi:hypothetical protein
MEDALLVRLLVSATANPVQLHISTLMMSVSLCVLMAIILLLMSRKTIMNAWNVLMGAKNVLMTNLPPANPVSHQHMPINQTLMNV